MAGKLWMVTACIFFYFSAISFFSFMIACSYCVYPLLNRERATSTPLGSWSAPKLSVLSSQVLPPLPTPLCFCYTNGNDATSALWNLPFLICRKKEEEEEHALFVRCMHHRYIIRCRGLT